MALNLRQLKILELIQPTGRVLINDLVEKFSVTPQTIRRDITNLCDLGFLQRHHGGAALPQLSSVENIAYRTRKAINAEAKKVIGILATEQIPENSSLFINIGTTTEEVAKALRLRNKLRVITNNLNVAGILSDRAGIELIVAGGVVRHRDHAIVGESAVDFISQFKVDFGVIGISGIDSDGTLLDFDYREVRIAQAIIKNSRKVILVADHSKFSRNAMVKLGHLRQISTLVTDRKPPEEMVEVIEASETKLVITDSEEG
tara:strand:+ start:1446 stop:2225 length:780 start_codon:yes stop_codon:yes gene_type:complete